MDLYNDGPEGDPTDAETPAESGPDDEQEPSGKETFLVPKSALGGKDPEPGDICKFKAVASHEDEVEFEYVPHDKPESKMDQADKAISNMAASGGGGE